MGKKEQHQFRQSLRVGKYDPRIRALVLGNKGIESYLRHGLEKRGCHCSFAPSLDNAIKLAGQNDFDLIVCTMPLEEEDPFISQLIGSKCTVLYCHPVQGTWPPIMSHGKKCFGAPALSPFGVIELIDRIAVGRDIAAA